MISLFHYFSKISIYSKKVCFSSPILPSTLPRLLLLHFFLFLSLCFIYCFLIWAQFMYCIGISHHSSYFTCCLLTFFLAPHYCLLLAVSIRLGYNSLFLFIFVLKLLIPTSPLKGPIHDSDLQSQPRCAARSRLRLLLMVYPHTQRPICSIFLSWIAVLNNVGPRL